MQQPKRVGIGGFIVLVIGGLVIAGWISSAFSRPSASPTPTPTGSYAARNIPINQLTGADWLTMSFEERGRVVVTASELRRYEREHKGKPGPRPKRDG